MERTAEPIRARSIAVIASDLAAEMTLAEYGKARRIKTHRRHPLRRSVRWVHL